MTFFRGLVIMQTQHRLELIERECRIRTNLKEIQFTHYFSNENYKNKLATCPKNKYEIYQCQKSAFLNSTETSE